VLRYCFIVVVHVSGPSSALPNQKNVRKLPDVISSLKLKRVYRENYATRAQARASIHDYLCFYSRKPRHSSLGYLSLIDLENQPN
jgi:hypothetical protein